MTTYARTITDLLNDDGTLLSLLTGGVINFPDSGRKGINRTQIKEAFDPVKGLLKPFAVVMGMSETPDGQAFIPAEGYATTITPIAIWIYDNGDVGYDTIEAAFDRIYTLLQNQRITGAFLVLFRHVLRDRREPELNGACCYQAIWNVHGYRSS